MRSAHEKAGRVPTTPGLTAVLSAWEPARDQSSNSARQTNDFEIKSASQYRIRTAIKTAPRRPLERPRDRRPKIPASLVEWAVERWVKN